MDERKWGNRQMRCEIISASNVITTISFVFIINYKIYYEFSISSRPDYKKSKTVKKHRGLSRVKI